MHSKLHATVALKTWNIQEISDSVYIQLYIITTIGYNVIECKFVYMHSWNSFTVEKTMKQCDFALQHQSLMQL